MTDSKPFYTAQIRAHCPDLRIDSVVLNEDGQYNDVLIVNGTWVFRFATVSDAADTLRREVAILNALQTQLSLAVPDPVYVHADVGTIGETFVGYRLIPGRPLWREAFAEIVET